MTLLYNFKRFNASKGQLLHSYSFFRIELHGGERLRLTLHEERGQFIKMLLELRVLELTHCN